MAQQGTLFHSKKAAGRMRHNKHPPFTFITRPVESKPGWPPFYCALLIISPLLVACRILRPKLLMLDDDTTHHLEK